MRCHCSFEGFYLLMRKCKLLIMNSVYHTIMSSVVSQKSVRTIFLLFFWSLSVSPSVYHLQSAVLSSANRTAGEKVCCWSLSLFFSLSPPINQLFFSPLGYPSFVFSCFQLCSSAPSICLCSHLLCLFTM